MFQARERGLRDTAPAGPAQISTTGCWRARPRWPAPSTRTRRPEARLVEETGSRSSALLTETGCADAICRPWEAVLPWRRRCSPGARLLGARSFLKNARGATAEVELTTVLQQEPSHVEARLVLGRLSRDRGLRRSAPQLPAGAPWDRPRASEAARRGAGIAGRRPRWKACSSRLLEALTTADRPRTWWRDPASTGQTAALAERPTRQWGPRSPMRG